MACHAPVERLSEVGVSGEVEAAGSGYGERVWAVSLPFSFGSCSGFGEDSVLSPATLGSLAGLDMVAVNLELLN